MSYGSDHSIETLLPDTDVHDVLDNSLTLLRSGNTLVHEVEGHEDVIVRQSFTAINMLPDVERAAETFNRLPEHGIPCVPFIPQPHQDQVYIITQRVHGDKLNQLLAPDAEPAIVAETDVLLGTLGGYYHDRKQDGERVAPDLEATGQYMRGRVAGDPAVLSRAVDLEPFDLSFGPDRGQDYEHIYEEYAFWLARSVVDTEQRVAQELPAARHGIEEVLTLVDRKAGLPRMIATAIEDMLENGTKYDYSRFPPGPLVADDQRWDA
ncbi:MAG TPA: hypothetical protein VK674_06090 [Candidatus Limnocylindria bacterium]|nr:hypothetical protein [Candidatus Limnocylindria bacterium]